MAALLRREDQKDGLIKECQGALLRALHGERSGGATWWGALGRTAEWDVAAEASTGQHRPHPIPAPVPAGAPLQNLFPYVVADMSKEEQCECSLPAAAAGSWVLRSAAQALRVARTGVCSSEALSMADFLAQAASLWRM